MKTIEKAGAGPAVALSLGPALWPAVKASSWHRRRALVGQVGALHLYPPHTRARLNETFRASALCLFSVSGKMRLCGSEDNGRAPSLSVELLAANKEPGICSAPCVSH